MLAELKESRNQEARYQQFRQTFTEFLQKGEVKHYHVRRGHDSEAVIKVVRTEKFTGEGETFLLEVRAGYMASSDISQAIFMMRASTEDGQVAEKILFQPEFYKILRPTELSKHLDSLADVEKIVREFNAYQKAPKA